MTITMTKQQVFDKLSDILAENYDEVCSEIRDMLLTPMYFDYTLYTFMDIRRGTFETIPVLTYDGETLGEVSPYKILLGVNYNDTANRIYGDVEEDAQRYVTKKLGIYDEWLESYANGTMDFITFLEEQGVDNLYEDYIWDYFEENTFPKLQYYIDEKCLDGLDFYDCVL